MVILYLLLLAAHLGVMGLAMSRGSAARWSAPRVVISMVASCAAVLIGVHLLQRLT